MLGAEGLHQVGSSIAALRMYYALGVRYVTLTHFCDNIFATSANTANDTGKDAGLKGELGRRVVHEMNRLGMLVDLSHVSHQTSIDAIHASRAPPIFSHSSSYAVYAHPRNVQDSVLRMIRQSDGVVMVCFYAQYVAANATCNLDTLVDHILHIVHVAGWAHVGLGSDFDGFLETCEGMEDVSKYPDLLERLVARCPNATDEQIDGLLGANLIRVWKKAEAVRDEMRYDLPSEGIPN